MNEFEIKSKIYEQIKDLFNDVDIYGWAQKKIFCDYDVWHVGIYNHTVKKSGKIKSYTIECIPEHIKSFLDKDNNSSELCGFDFRLTFIDNVIPDTYEQYLIFEL